MPYHIFKHNIFITTERRSTSSRSDYAPFTRKTDQHSISFLNKAPTCFFYLNRLGRNDARFLFLKTHPPPSDSSIGWKWKEKKKRTPYMVALDTTKRCMCTEEEECNQDLVSVSPSSFLFGLRYIFFFFSRCRRRKRGEMHHFFSLGFSDMGALSWRLFHDFFFLDPDGPNHRRCCVRFLLKAFFFF